MDWYYADAGRQVGPIDDAAFRQLSAAGTIREETLVWQAGMSAWVPYRDLNAPIRNCAECGGAFPPDELAAFGSVLVCGACKPAYAQKLREGVLQAGHLKYAGFWIRFWAVVIDGIIEYVILLMVGGLAFGIAGMDFNNVPAVLFAEGVLFLVQLLLGFSYEVWFIGKLGATPGKLAFGLTVVSAEGTKISYQRAMARCGAKFISTMTFLIGYLMAAFDIEKRALHDRICDTRVIRK